jgi:predicted secreted protein
MLSNLATLRLNAVAAAVRLQPSAAQSHIRMQTATRLPFAALTATVVLLAAAAGVRAQDLPAPPPHDVLQLAATGTVEAQQDLLTMDLATTREGEDAAVVQRQLTAAVDAALGQVKPFVQPGQLDVRTGRFGLAPRWRDGHIDGWTGTADVLLEGRDFGRITQTASRVTTLSVRGVSFGLSRAERERVEHEAQAQAVQRFRAKADELARSFGFSGYALREVSVSADDQGYLPMRMAAPAAAAMGTAAPVPIEAGKTTVRVTVSGSVQLR